MSDVRSWVVAGACLLSALTVAAPTTPAVATPTASPSRSGFPTRSGSPTPVASATSSTPTLTPTGTPTASPRVATPIQAKYASLGGPSSFLGAPVGMEEPLSGGQYQRYQHGVITHRADVGAHVVEEEASRAWLAKRTVLGLAHGEGFDGGRQGRAQLFDQGWVFSRSDLGAHAVDGAVLERYSALARERGGLGLPTGDAVEVGQHMVAQTFEFGAIYWRSDVGTTHLVGEIAAKYRQFGAENGSLGVPTAGEFRGNDGASYLNWFSRGASIVWNPRTGAHEVHGAIRDRWHALAAEGGVVGAPTSDEFDGRNGARVNRFARGVIIWTPRTGAHAVFGGLLEEYARRGWEGGDLGAPISGEWRYATGWAQDFENGRLLMVEGVGYRTQVRANAYVRAAQPGDVQRTFRPGCPVGPDQLRVVEMNHLGYDGRVHRGMLVLRWDVVDRTVRAFSGASWESFPIHSMLNPDVWGNDPDQMTANNTSGFFCRSVVGNPYAMSPHSYGRAVDINTVQNPYFDGSRWWPENGRPWIDRNRRDPGMLFDGGLMTRNMTDNGYYWGGWWSAKDYHHFQVN